MKRAFALLLAALQIPLLAGRGGVRSNYRELEQLLVIQTMGLDSRVNGVTLSLAAKGDSRQGVKRLKADASSMSAAMERIRGASFEEELFSSHIAHLLIGEKAAETGLSDLLADLSRSAELRLDMPLYVVREDTAERAVMEVGDERRGICDVMDTVEQLARRHADCGVTSAAQLLDEQARFGAALICALRLSPAAEQEGATDKAPALTAEPEGYGVLRDGKLVSYLTREQAVAVSFLKNETAEAEIPLRDSYGKTAVLELRGGRCRIRPVWSEDGQLTALRITAETDASILEQGAVGDEAYSDRLAARLEEYLAREIESVLRVSRELKADFLGLAAHVERADPAAFRRLDQDFAELLPALELEITVGVRLRHSFDRKEP